MKKSPGRRERRKEAKQPTKGKPFKEKRSWLERLRKKFPTIRFISTKREGLNMPKFQRCPHCGTNSKRQEKALGGANYWCHQCQLSFFIKH